MTFPKVHANQLDAVSPTQTVWTTADGLKVVILTASGILPALDGSLLQNVPSTGGGTVNSVGVTGSTGLTVTGSPVTSTGTIALTLGTELQGLSGLASIGLVQRTGAGTYAAALLTSTQVVNALGFTPGIGTVTSVTAIGSTGLVVTGSPVTSSGTISFTLSTELQGLSSLATTGYVTRTSAGSYVSRTFAAGAGITLSNPDGIAGNTTITNTGLSSASAGAGISISGSSAISITNTGVTSLTGTANQVFASSATGGVTLSLPQNIHAGATPQFSGLTLLGGATNSGLSSAPVSFGSISASGANGGYGGIQFPSVTGNRTLMLRTSDGLGGIYNVTAGVWDWYYDPSALTFRVNNGSSLVLSQANAAGNYVSSIAASNGVSASASTGGVSITGIQFSAGAAGIVPASGGGTANFLRADGSWASPTPSSFTSLGVGTAASGVTGEIRATNNITAFFSSDSRLKENVVNISNAIAKVEQLNGVTFDWTDEYIERQGGEDGYFVRKHDIGVIAQEVQKVLPELTAVRNDGYMAVKYDRLVAVLIEAIKELNARVEELETK